MESISLKTQDNFRLVADFYKAENFNGSSLILAHQFQRNRSDWKDLAGLLNDLGFNVIAVDLRGHGESDGKLAEFFDDDYRRMVFDIKTAVDFVKSKQPRTKIGLLGASIGANTVINAAVQYGADAVVALSPGLDYHGIIPEMGDYAGPLLMVATTGDQYSEQSAQKLIKKSQSKDKQLLELAGNAHGIFMFEMSPSLSQKIVDWLTLKLAR